MPEVKGQDLKKYTKAKKKKERFLIPRMWVSTILSALMNDRGSIPPNIGNNILVTNNLYITRKSLNAIIVVSEMSEDTPVGVISDMIQYVKRSVEDLIIDVTMKNNPYWIDTSDSGLKSRVETWTKFLNSKTISEREARRAARQLYTVRIAESGEKLYRSKLYITLRATDGRTLSKGIDVVTDYLKDIALFKIIRSDVKTYLDSASILSNVHTRVINDAQWMLTSQQVLAEMFPQTQGLNDASGTLMGITRENNAPYWINFRSTANAKNIYVAAKSGFGKTFYVLSALLDAFADGYNICIMDLKGTEFNAFTKSCGGVTLSMRANSTYYINTFKMNPDEVVDGGYSLYFDNRIRLSKNKMMIICNLTGDEETVAEALVEEFLSLMYKELGVISENPNTWIRTNNLTPYKVFDMFEHYMSAEVCRKYGTVSYKCLSRFRMYMSRQGSYAYAHRDAYDYKQVLDAKVLTFDFGILENSTSNVDETLFKLHVMDMKMINDEYVSYKKSKGEWTVKVLEESQICEDYLLQIYVREMTLRRAQNQVTFLLGNSVSALAEKEIAKPLLESVNILVLGVLNESSQDYLVKEYDLGRDNKKKLELINSDMDYMHTFLLVNRMQRDATTAFVKTYVPPSVVNSKLFKVVDTDS